MTEPSPLLFAALRIGLTVLALTAVAGAFVWWQRRNPAALRHLRVRDRLSVGRGVSLVLVQVEGQKLLVGVSADGVRLVRDLGDVVDRSAAPAVKPSPRNGGFATLLARAATEIRR